MKTGTIQPPVSLRQKKRARTAYAIIIPFMVYIMLWNLVPMIYGIYLGFTEWNGLASSPKWVGLKNYQRFFQNPKYLQLLWRQFVLGVVSLSCNIVISFLVALALNVKHKGRGFFRSVIYIPCLAATSVTTSIFLALLESPYGALDNVIVALGGQPITWSYSAFWMFFWMIFYGVWKGIGPSAIIWLGGLQGIDQSLYEAAMVDGANKRQRIRYITLPGLRYVAIYVFLTGIIGAMQMFDVVMFISGGGPYGSTDVLMYQIYRDGIINFNVGMAGAESTILGIITSVFAVGFFLFTQKRKD